MTLAEQELRQKLRERIGYITQRPDQARMWLPDTLNLIATGLDSAEQGIEDLEQRIRRLEQRLEQQEDDGR